jgi:hypothetical protein
MQEGGTENACIEEALRAGLTTAENKELVRLLGLACRWRISPNPTARLRRARVDGSLPSPT